MRVTWILAAALAVLAPHAALAEGWRHAPSRIAVPDLPEGFQLGATADNRRDGSDVFVQLGSASEPVTLYVYRSAFPNPALWFERTRRAMNSNVGSDTAAADPRTFTLGQASAPNGLREEVVLAPGGNFRTTAVAIVQYGEWIVKARITSSTLDRDGIRARLDRLLAAVRLPGTVPAPAQLIVPAACGEANRMRGTARAGSGEDNVMAGILLVGVNGQARGREGLVATPAAWCRDTSAHPATLVTLYRRRDGGAWVALLADSGMAIGAETIDNQAMSYAATPSATIFVQMFNGIPAPDPAIESAFPYLVGRARGAASVDAATGSQISVALPER